VVNPSGLGAVSGGSTRIVFHTSSPVNLSPRSSGFSCYRPSRLRLMVFDLGVTDPNASLKKLNMTAAMSSSSTTVWHW
jgi:hypothetical protein